MSFLNHPFHFDGRGRTAQTGHEGHIRDLIAQVLFTSPGERVNRPEFGSGLMQMVFAPGGGEIATATRALVEGALQQYLGELIQIDEVQVDSEESTLKVTVRYVVLTSQERQTAEFRSQGLP